MKQSMTRWLLMGAVMVLGMTTAMAQKSVLNESFTEAPANWEVYSSVDGQNFWKFDDGNAYFFAPFENVSGSLTTPEIDLKQLDNVPSVKISYKLAANSDATNELKILYRKSGESDWTDWKALEATDSQQTVKYALPEALKDAKVQLQIAAAYKLGGETRIYLFSVENKTEAADAPTGLTTEDLTTKSVTLYWDACNSPKFLQYNLKVSTTEIDPATDEGNVLDQVGWGLNEEWFAMSELTSNTAYWFYVQYDCGDGDVSPWAEASFRTPCEAIKAPYTENFENNLSNCYETVKEGSKFEVSGEYPYNSTKSLKSTSGKGAYNYLILPEFNGEVNKQQVAFMAAALESGNTYARTLTIGVCDEATAESFTAVKSLDLPKGRTWESVVVSLKGYTGNGKFIAFKIGNADKENRLFIDDIMIEAASACPKPMFVEVYEIAPNSAKLKWVETGNASEWNLVVSLKPLNNPEDIEPDESKGEFAGSVSANPYTLGNLKPNTTYYAYLASGCGSSEWTKAVEFKTAREVSYPYVEHFDRMKSDAYTNNTAAVPDSWVMDDRGNNPDYANYYDKQYTSDNYRPYVTTKENNETTAYVNASLLLRGTGISATTPGSSTGYTSIAMLPAMPKAVKETMITFWAYTTSALTMKFGVANTQTNDLPQGKQLGENITEVGSVALAGNSKWTKYSFSFSDYAGSGKYIALYLKPGTGTPAVYIDDITVDDIPPCNAVANLKAEATGVDKATVTWEETLDAKKWNIKVSTTAIDPAAADGDVLNETVSTQSKNLTGLAMGGTYYIYVSPNCGDFWMSTSVTTLVGLQVPYYNDFTDETTGANANRGPKNWKMGYTYTDSPSATSSYWPHVNATAWTNPPADVVKNCVYFNNSTSASAQFPYAVLPELLNADVKDLKVSFYAYWDNADPSSPANYACVKGSYYGVLKIGVVSSPSDINKTNKFTNVTEVAAVRCKAPKAAEKFVVDMSKYSGSGKYIVFYQDTAKNNYMKIDNLSISLATDPQAVSDVAASNISQTGAKLTWTENGQATKWEVRVFDAAQEDPATGTPIWSNANLTSKQATITGLTHSTQYFAYARSIQNNGNGAWGSTSFYSECGAWAVPFYEDWNKYATGGTTNNTLHPCYNVEHSTASTWPYVRMYTGASQYHESQSNLMYMTAGTNKVCQLEFPKLNAPINTLQMELEASAYSSYAGAKYITFFGVVTSDGTFHEVAQRTNSAQKLWEPWVIDFSGYTGEEGVIAIRLDPAMAATASGTTATTQYVFIENVKIGVIPQCKQIQPNDMEATEIDSVSAKITWPAAEASKWNLKVSTVALDDPGAATADVFDGEMTTTTKTLTNLDDNTKFYVYVQTVRPDKECVSDWSRAFTFKTLCKKRIFPYSENFDQYETTGAGNLPDCSTICGQDADHSYVTTRGTGNKALYLRQVTKDHNNYFAFPALSVDSVKRLQLSMSVNPGSTTVTNYYYYEVGVMTDPNDPSTFVAVKYDSVQGAAATVFYDRIYTFEGYKGDAANKYGTYIALKPLQYQNPTTVLSDPAKYYAGTLYIDNVTIDFIETCAKPTDLTASDIKITEATLTWVTDSETANHRVRIFATADADPNSDSFIAEKVVAAKEAAFDGLIGNTTYYAYVRKECGGTDGNSKWSSVYSFKTECPAVRPLPYEEGFEDYEANAIPDCWTPLDNTTNGKSRVGGSSSYAITGLRYLNVNYGSVGSSSGTSYYKSSIVTPALDVESLKEVLLCFDARTSSGTGSLKIEAVSDNTSNAEAIVLTTIQQITTTPQKVYLKLADYYNSAQPYQYLRFSPETQGVSIYVDNMIFTKDMNLVFPVEALKAQAVTESAIKFSFVEPTPSVTQWQVAYVAAGGEIADATVLTIDAKEYTITGLTANTSYDIYVRGNVEGDAWVGPLNVATIQTPAPLPLISGFEDDADMWGIYKAKNVQGNPYPNYFIVGAADRCGATGSKALYITNDSTSYEYQTKDDEGNIGFSNAWAARNINIEHAGTYIVKIKVKAPANKENESDYATAHLFPAGATILAGNATMLNGTTRAGTAVTDVPASNIFSLMGKTFHQSEWVWVNKQIDVAEAGIYTLALFWYNASVGAQYGQALAVDSVMVEEYLCSTPKNFEFIDLKAEKVTLQWFGGQNKEFEYVVSRFANLGNPALIDAEDKVAAGTLTEGPQVTIDGLLPNTNYSFYVRTICAESLTDWVEYDFQTPCAAEMLPYTETFVETPSCWILQKATVTYKNYKTPEMDEAEKWTCLTLNDGGLAILPELEVPINKVMIEIGLFNSGFQCGAVSIGVMDNTWDANTFKELKPCQTMNKLSSSSSSGNPLVLEEFDKALNLYQGNGKVLAIKNTTSEPINVKYVKLTELPDCMTPSQVEITYPGETEATVNWLAGLETNWEIKLNEGQADEKVIPVTENPYRLKGLEQGATYTVSVRAICDATHQSEWSNTITFQTLCGVHGLPLFEDFSGLPKPNGSTDLKRASLICWDNWVSEYNIDMVFKGQAAPFQPAANVYAGDVWVSNWLNALGTYDQLHSYRRSSPTYRYKWFISPLFAIEGDATLSFDIRVCNNEGNAAENPDRTFVAISTDNGATWKEADATLITDIDSVYTTKSVSLNKYVGQNIRIAFYDENVNSTQKMGLQPFLLIDNIRMNCAATYEYEAYACQGYDYEGYGFGIAKEDIPVFGEDSTYTRFAKSDGTGCDSTVVLKLTTQKATIETKYDTICRGEVYAFGDQVLTDPNPEGMPYFIRATNEYGCDATRYLYLTVNPADTVDAMVTILNTELPYMVDDYYTIPANAPVGVDTVIVKIPGTCTFNRYYITINQCVEAYSYTETLCEDQFSYTGNGFTILNADMPAAGTSKDYVRHAFDELGCDSVITLTLWVTKADTTAYEVAIDNTMLPYEVDEYYTVPADARTGLDTIVTVKLGDDCAYNRYHITVSQCEQPYAYEETVCEDATSYAGYGFEIAADEMPAALQSKVYTRHAMNEQGCDSIITLRLTAHNDTTDIHITKRAIDLPYKVDEIYTIPADAQVGTTFEVVMPVSGTECSFNRYIVMITNCESLQEESDAVCEDQTSYQGYGFVIEAADMPEAGKSKQYHRMQENGAGCTNITLTLSVTANDTANVPVAIENTLLPYKVDEYYTVPVDAKIGEPFEVVMKIGDTGCSYNRYQVSISQCTQAINLGTEELCADQTSYEGNGFAIAAADMPAVGTMQTYERHAMDAAGCDSIITLTLRVLRNDTLPVPVTKLNTELPYTVDEYYTIPADATGTFEVVKKIGDTGCSYKRYIVTISECSATYRFADTLCEDEDSYTGYGFEISKADMPAPGSYNFERHALNEQGCDSVVLFTLTITANDTLDEIVNKLNTELPFEVDEYYTIPADATGSFEVVKKLGDTGCSYKRYIVSIEQCGATYEVTGSVCELDSLFSGYGFTVAKDSMPAAGTSQNYERHALNELGCDSTIILTLEVIKSDTNNVERTILVSELPYVVDDYYTVPDSVRGQYIEIVPVEDECLVNRYVIIIDDGEGVLNVTTDDMVDHIVVYDIFGHELTTFHNNAEAEKLDLPSGVYMVRTVMRSGAATTGKFIVR